MKKIILLAALALFGAPVLLAGPATAQDKPKPNVETYFKTMFKKLPEGWESRIVQDETQRICSETHNSPSQAEFEKIKAREVATIEYPADGNVMGDWKKGEKIAQNGRGGQFSDEPGTERGGNCYACHQMATAEVSYGTLGRASPATARRASSTLRDEGSVRQDLQCAKRAAVLQHASLRLSQVPIG